MYGLSDITRINLKHCNDIIWVFFVTGDNQNKLEETFVYLFYLLDIKYLSEWLLCSSSDNLLVPKPNTELYKSSFSFSGPKVWNSLPTEIKTSKTVFEFKNSYKLLIIIIIF